MSEKKCISSFGWKTIWKERIWEFQQCLGKYGNKKIDCEEMDRVQWENVVVMVMNPSIL